VIKPHKSRYRGVLQVLLDKKILFVFRVIMLGAVCGCDGCAVAVRSELRMKATIGKCAMCHLALRVRYAAFRRNSQIGTDRMVQRKAAGPLVTLLYIRSAADEGCSLTREWIM
jgi:hypothetical protein